MQINPNKFGKIELDMCGISWEQLKDFAVKFGEIKSESCIGSCKFYVKSLL